MFISTMVVLVKALSTYFVDVCAGKHHLTTLDNIECCNNDTQTCTTKIDEVLSAIRNSRLCGHEPYLELIKAGSVQDKI